MTNQRKRRANGEESRRKIIEAAMEIASERGYEGTSISAVSERSGLPASSIYWHFANKDALIAAVIQHSFDRWRELTATWPSRTEPDPSTALIESMRNIGRALTVAPDFLRLGLMLTLERRPQEPSARALFLDIRRSTRADGLQWFTNLFSDSLSRADAQMMAMLAMAVTDGLFIASETDGDRFDGDAAFTLMGIALQAVAEHLSAQRGAPTS
jgi:AcrR family transcriptional regulator